MGHVLTSPALSDRATRWLDASYMFDMDGYKMTADGENLAFAEGQRFSNELPLSRRHGGKGRQGHSERLDKPHRHPHYLSDAAKSAAGAPNDDDEDDEDEEGRDAGSALPHATAKDDIGLLLRKRSSLSSFDSHASGSSSAAAEHRRVAGLRQRGGEKDDASSILSSESGADQIDPLADSSLDEGARQFSRDLVRLAKLNEAAAAAAAAAAAQQEHPSAFDEDDGDADHLLPEGVPRTRRGSSTSSTGRPVVTRGEYRSRSRRPNTQSGDTATGSTPAGQLDHVQEASYSDSETQLPAGPPTGRSLHARAKSGPVSGFGRMGMLPGDATPNNGEAPGARAQSPEYDWSWGELPKKRDGPIAPKERRLRATSADLDDRLFPGSAHSAGASGRLTYDSSDPYTLLLQVEDVTYTFQLSLCWREGFGSNPDSDEDQFEENRLSYQRFMEDTEIVNDVRLVVKYNGTLLTWENASTVMATLSLYRQSLPGKVEGAAGEIHEAAGIKEESRWRKWFRRTAAPVDGKATGEPMPRSQTDTALVLEKEGEAPGLPPINTNVEPEKKAPEKIYVKTLRLSSDQLKSLNLKKGANTLTFSVTSSYSGVATCTARIFLWEASHQIVVSDIDGTITKSDALGHVFTMIGRDWTHQGVAKLYTDIARNGYRIMYLTSRAIGQADTTRDYLRGIKQGNYQLPDGPVIMSPDRLIASLHREVILRKPEVFKMACLRDIARLFGCDPRASQATKEEMLKDGIPDRSDVKAPGAGAATSSSGPGTQPTPFYAGFGNRITDALSYRSVNIPSSRIFTIDTNGEVKMELLEMTGYKSSWVLSLAVYLDIERASHAQLTRLVPTVISTCQI